MSIEIPNLIEMYSAVTEIMSTDRCYVLLPDVQPVCVGEKKRSLGTQLCMMCQYDVTFRALDSSNCRLTKKERPLYQYILFVQEACIWQMLTTVSPSTERSCCLLYVACRMQCCLTCFYTTQSNVHRRIWLLKGLSHVEYKRHTEVRLGQLE